MNTETNYNEQALVGKQQLAIKMQLAAQREDALVAKQQLMVKAGLAARRNSAQS